MEAPQTELPARGRAGGFGIRARLLALLLPGIVALLAFDSWNDYHALSEIVEDAYDQAMLEPVIALDNSITLAADGSIRVKAPFDIQAMFDETRPQHKHLHLGVTPLTDATSAAHLPPGLVTAPATATDDKPPPAAQETTLMGVSALPPVPAAATSTSPQRANASKPVWYDGAYLGYPVRIVALRRTIFDGHARAYLLLIQAAESTGLRDEARASTLRQELWRDARMLAVVILLVWFGVSLSLRPLERLRKSVLATPPDALVTLDATHVPHEVRPLVESVNHHVASHRQALARQTSFLADASHQLRTPLAILLTQASYALREADPGRMRETLHAIVAQLSRSRRLSEQLLALADASEPAGNASAPALADLNTIARDVVLQYLPLAHEKHQDMGWVDARGDDAPEDEDIPPAGGKALSAADMVAPVLAQAGELHEVLSNLVHNAVAYTPAGGTITVATRLDGNSVCVEVCDSGPGIPAHQRAAVFERFAQLPGPAAASASHHGAGLGMSIARAYAQRNGGDIELADSDARPDGSAGLRAILRLPRAF